MPSKIRKRGICRYRGSVTVKGVTRQRLFADGSKKSYRAAVVWENETRKALEEELSEIATGSLVVSDWVEEYLNDVQPASVHQNRHQVGVGIPVFAGKQHPS